MRAFSLFTFAAAILGGVSALTVPVKRSDFDSIECVISFASSVVDADALFPWFLVCLKSVRLPETRLRRVICTTSTLITIPLTTSLTSELCHFSSFVLDGYKQFIAGSSKLASQPNMSPLTKLNSAKEQKNT